MNAMENYFRTKLSFMALVYIGLIAVAMFAKQA